MEIQASAAPTDLRWSIGTTLFGYDVSFGNASLANTYLGTSRFGESIYESTFAISGLLSAGTYYLTLANGRNSENGAVYWDQNNGPSTAYISDLGMTAPIGSESFQL